MNPDRLTIKLRQIQYFLQVAETLHFSKAAERLFVTQPTLSHQIAELEEILGTQLFDRAGKTVRLTSAGSHFRVHAQRALKELNAGCIALTELDGLVRGTLSIGVSQSFVPKLLPPVLGQYTMRYPGISLRVEDMTATEIERQLADGTIDVGIAFAPALMEDTELEPLIEERLLLVVARTHKFAEARKLSLIELNGERLALLGKEYTTRMMLERYFEDASARPDVVCESNSINIMLAAIRAGDIATIVPESSISNDLDIRVIALCDPIPLRTSALLWPRHSFRTAAARKFGEMIRQHFVSLRTNESAF